MQVNVLLQSENAQLPRYGSKYAAGLDLISCEQCVVPAMGRVLVDTGLSIELPPGTYGRIAPRSGLAVKHGIDVGAGVIDLDFTGIVKVLLFNLTDVDYQITVGDRIAQLIITPYVSASVNEVKSIAETARSFGGFGSTGY